jgi:hypothetical protein
VADAQTDARYRKVYPRIWRNNDFLAMSSDDKTLTFYCLTGPHMNRIGLCVLSIGNAAEETGLPISKVKTRLAHICNVFGWRYDAASRVLWVPSWWEWNKPENANVLKGALRDVTEVPHSAWHEEWARETTKVCERLGVTLGERYEEVSRKSPKRLAIQEQEQEQDLTLEETLPKRSASRTQPPDAVTVDAEWLLESYPRWYAEERNGARCVMRPAFDGPAAFGLVQTWPDRSHLERMCRLFLRADNIVSAHANRGLALFADKYASGCDAKLRERGAA